MNIDVILFGFIRRELSAFLASVCLMMLPTHYC